MSFNVDTDQMDWKDESSWMFIAVAAGVLLSLLFNYFHRFPDANTLFVTVICCAGFYILSVLLRLQNQRGRLWLDRSIVVEAKLKFVFPVVGFVLGIALLMV